MYTQRATKLTSQDVEKLTSHGFVVDPESLKEGVSEEKDLGEGVLDHEEVQLRSLQGEDQPPHAFVEIEEDLLFSEHRTPYGESTHHIHFVSPTSEDHEKGGGSVHREY